MLATILIVILALLIVIEIISYIMLKVLMKKSNEAYLDKRFEDSFKSLTLLNKNPLLKASFMAKGSTIITKSALGEDIKDEVLKFKKPLFFTRSKRESEGADFFLTVIMSEVSKNSIEDLGLVAKKVVEMDFPHSKAIGDLVISVVNNGEINKIEEINSFIYYRETKLPFKNYTNVIYRFLSKEFF